jgi:hypothetical protein
MENPSPRYWATLGDQTNPKVINAVLQSKSGRKTLKTGIAKTQCEEKHAGASEGSKIKKQGQI